ncbi:MAG TPA: hypothetical protein DGD08_09590 [Gemmatimonas aurantiaca]|uniref:Cysteine-rich CWC family protein n=1 Tax=Gemmatimonas aurantiaca TaxID=173480 RepID=A0A3D4V9Y6_9BACT|nr:hypothetical protein [Gemmatimonas aurantiaca]
MRRSMWRAYRGRGVFSGCISPPLADAATSSASRGRQRKGSVSFPPALSTDPRRCPSCGVENGCTMAAGACDASACWCSRAVAYLPGLLTTERPAPSAAPEPMSCYCEPCLSAIRARGATRLS